MPLGWSIRVRPNRARGQLPEFERYAAEHRARCEPEIPEYRQVVAGLAQSAASMQPPARVWERIVEEIERDPRSPERQP